MFITKKMSRGKLLVALAGQNQDPKILPQVSSREKVYQYLRNLEVERKLDTDPYEFRESSNGSFPGVDSDSIPVQRKNYENPIFDEPIYVPYHDNYGSFISPITKEKNTDIEALKQEIETETETRMKSGQEISLINVEKTNQNLILFDNSMQTVSNLTKSDKKIKILDYKIFPTRSYEPVGGNPSDPSVITRYENCDELIYGNEVEEDDKNISTQVGDNIVISKKKYNTRPKKTNLFKQIFSSFSDENTVDMDYSPPPDEMQDTSSSEGSEPRKVPCDALTKDCIGSAEVQVQPADFQSLPPLAESFPVTESFPLTESSPMNESCSPVRFTRIENFENKLKKDLCPFCFEEVDHFSRHLFKRHSDEEAIKKISKLLSKSKERRIAIMSLRKRGNFILHNQKNTLKVVRKPNKSLNSTDQHNDEYYPCPSCLGFYKKSYLWRHKKICKSKISSANGPQRHLSDSQTFLATTGMLGNFLNKSRIKNEVFGIMRPDNISYEAKTDTLICLFGESYINKHKRKQMNVVVSNKIRELARLKLTIKKSTTIKNLIEVLKPECYELIVASTKIICGYDPEKKTFTASSLALHMGTTLKFLCDVAKKAILTKNPLFIHGDKKTTIEQIGEIRDMINMHWCNDVSSLANKVLNEQKILKPKLLPLTEDIMTLNNYIKTVADGALNGLKKNEEIITNYKYLTECTLVLVLVFNRKRVGEFLNIATYQNNMFSANQEECLSSLSKLEKSMCATLKRVIVFGKGSKPVPVLFTKRMQRYIETILTIRETTEIVPKTNSYVFANPGSSERWMNGSSVLRKYAHKCGAKSPELLTGTRFRKQIATILQLINFENDEMEQIATFMGHTEKTHREFYRLTEDVYQTAKVAKVLLLLNNGKGSEFKGKSLANIEVTEDFIDDEEANVETTDTVYENNKIHGTNLADSDNDQEKCVIEKKMARIHKVHTTKNEKNKKVKNGEEKENETDSDQEGDSEEKNATTENIKIIKKSTRNRWSVEEKKSILAHFKEHLKKKLLPKNMNVCIISINIHIYIGKLTGCVSKHWYSILIVTNEKYSCLGRYLHSSEALKGIPYRMNN